MRWDSKTLLSNGELFWSSFLLICFTAIGGKNEKIRSVTDLAVRSLCIRCVEDVSALALSSVSFHYCGVN
jgi:hypothetical protein